jgi:hypothetical protein
MDALRNSKKNSLLAIAILFLFTFFNLILDAPRPAFSNSNYNISYFNCYFCQFYVFWIQIQNSQIIADPELFNHPERFWMIRLYLES